MAILMVLVRPAVQSISVGSNLTRAGGIIGDTMALARQEAVTKNRAVEVRFYKLRDGAGATNWRGIRILRMDESAQGPVTNVVSRMAVIPDGVIISTNSQLSPLLTAGITNSETLPNYGNVEYAGFRFRPNGAVANPINDANNFVTLHNINATGAPPANFYTVQVNPTTGKVSVYRP